MFSAIVLNAGMGLATSRSSTVAAGTSMRVASPGLLPTPQFRRYAAADGLPSMAGSAAPAAVWGWRSAAN